MGVARVPAHSDLDHTSDPASTTSLPPALVAPAPVADTLAMLLLAGLVPTGSAGSVFVDFAFVVRGGWLGADGAF